MTPRELEAIRATHDALARLERALHALSDGLELAADSLQRAQQKEHLTDDERARLHGRAFERTLEEIRAL